MKDKQIILFDMDGTIINSSSGITTSAQHALRQFGIEVESKKELENFIGPPLVDSFQYYGLSLEQAEEARKAYRAHYSQGGVNDYEIYPGMEELIKALKAKGKTLIVATTKPIEYAGKIVKDMGLAAYFDFVAGSEFSGERSNKVDLFEYALGNLGIATSRKDEMVMVGDSIYDIIGANQFGISSIAVLYGFGKNSELLAEKPTRTAGTVAELSEILG